jgi:hypothetical protein
VYIRSISIKAIVIGAFADLGSNLLLHFVLSIAMMLPRIGEMMQSGSAAVGAEVGQSLTYQAMIWVVAFASAILGGYVAAQVAKAHEVANGAASAWMSIAFNGEQLLEQLIAPSDPIVFYFCLTMVIAAPLLGAFGGYLRRQRKPQPA